jgi:hypothetical protein
VSKSASIATYLGSSSGRNTLNNPDVYRLLVGYRAWTPDEHEKWLVDILCEQLLEPDAE